VLWKRLNTETSQHGNASKKSGNPSKTVFFETFPQFLQETETSQHGNASKKSGNPSKTVFFETFPQFLQEKRKSLKTQFLRRFLKFLRGFRFSPDNYF